MADWSGIPCVRPRSGAGLAALAWAFFAVGMTAGRLIGATASTVHRPVALLRAARC